ncbi:MAG TPA: ABC transporter permease [Streptosporangiaceae bacterium]|nr:ABC transporter permease [Streptosporangiaceae bacterium]
MTSLSDSLRALRRGGRRTSLRQRAVRIALPTAVIVVILLLWQAACDVFHVASYLIPSPAAIGKALWTYRSMLASNTLPTLEQAAAGFVIGNAVALGLAIWFVHARVARQSLYPLAIVVQSMPLVALAPIFVIALGEGSSSKIAMTALISFFPMLVNATRGFEAVDRPLIELFQSVAASRLDIFFKLRWRTALPYIFIGFRLTASLCVIGAIIAEWIGASSGLGYVVINSTYDFNAPQLWASMVVSSVLVLCVFGLAGLVERVAVPWQQRSSADSASRM